MKKVPKYVVEMVQRRTRLSRQLRSACADVDKYCESIGLNINHPLFDEAALCTDIRIYCEEDAAQHITLEAIQKVLNEQEVTE